MSAPTAIAQEAPKPDTVKEGTVKERTVKEWTVTVRLTRTPEALSGVPLPVEAVSSYGRSAWKGIADGGAERQVTFSLSQSLRGEIPEDFVARTELPSGEFLTAPVVLQESGDVGEAILNFGELPSASPPTAATAAAAPDWGGAVGLENLLAVRQHTSRLVQTPRSDVNESVAVLSESGEEAQGVHFQYFRLRDDAKALWSDGPSSEEGGALDRLAVVALGQAPTAIRLPAALAPEDFAAGQGEWRPSLAKIWDSAPEEVREALMVCPPLQNLSFRTEGENALLIMPDATPDMNPFAPPYIGSATSGDNQTDSLFAYIRGGSLENARRTGARLQEQAEAALRGKFQNPLAATVGAYVLLKLSDLSRLDWVSNLAQSFPHLADGAIIYAWLLIYSGRTDEARKWLHTGLARGLPLYTEGLRLMRDGLNLLEGVFPDNPELTTDAARARRLASLANLESELTCIRLAPFVELMAD